MELSYSAFIEKVEENFNKLQIDYLNIYRAHRSRDLENFFLLQDQWNKAVRSEGPLSCLYELFGKYDDNGFHKSQIKDCLLQNNLGIIEYTKIILKRQFDFIVREFNNVAGNFDENEDYYTELLERFYDGDKTLTNDDFILIVQILFAEVYRVFENLFIEAYPIQQRYILNSASKFQQDDDEDFLDDPIQPIDLDYPDEVKTEIIKIMYDVLNEKFIEQMSIQEFTTYFYPGGVRRKIWWKANDLELAYLFDGFETVIDTMPVIKIRVNNNPKRLLCDTFLKQDGNPFIYKNLADNIRMGRKADKSEIDDDLFNLLIAITRKFNH